MVLSFLVSMVFAWYFFSLLVIMVLSWYFFQLHKKLYPCFSDDKLSIKFQRISKFSPTKVDDLSAFLAISEEQISKFSRCRVHSAIFSMQNIMVFFHFGTGIIMVYHGIFFWNLLRTMTRLVILWHWNTSFDIIITIKKISSSARARTGDLSRVKRTW